MKQHDYINLAQAIKASEWGLDHNLLDKCDFVDALCDILAADNKNFNKEKFMEAVM